MFLIVIYKDLFNMFCMLIVWFFVGFVIIDLVIGFVLELMVISCYFMYYYWYFKVECCEKIFNIVGIIVVIIINFLFLIVMVFIFV